MQEYDVSAKSYLSENLKVIISIWKMDQHDFSTLIGLNYPTFNSHMSKGTFPRVPTLLVISDVTGIPIDLFLRGPIPVYLIPDKPLMAGEKNPNMVKENGAAYRSIQAPLIDYSTLERRITNMENEINALRNRMDDCQ